MRIGALGALGILAGCARGPQEATAPVGFPTLDPDPPVEHRAVGLDDLRSIAGAARIELEVGPTEAVLATRGCADVWGAMHDGHTCYRCTLAVVEPVPEGTLHPLELPLRMLAETLLKYPHSFLRAARIERIALCSKLVGDHAPATRTAAPPAPTAIQAPTTSDDEEPVTGLADSTSRRLMVSLAESDVRRPDVTLHHEIFHLFDSATAPDGNHQVDPEWASLNPRLFRYQKQPSAALEAGFIDDYAKTAVAEDKASVFSYMLGYPDELCGRAVDDPILMAKARLLLARIERAAPQGDTGFITRRAPCLSGPPVAAATRR